MASAKSFLSRVFSSSIAFSRRASDASMRMPIICSSLNLLHFISGPFQWARVYFKLN